MATMKLILGIGLAVLVAGGVGWVWGASGRSDITRALQIAELRDELREGRAAVLAARLDIYSVNFGEASRHFEAARKALRAADTRLTDLGRDEDAKRLTTRLDADRRGPAHGRPAQSGRERDRRRRGEDHRRGARNECEALTVQGENV
jgi:hypothetical protein